MDDGMIHEVYIESEKDFPNPERGLMSCVNFHSASDSPLVSNTIETYRKLNRTIMYTGYYLTDFMESDISEEYMELMRQNFSILRKSGAKCVLRFAYKTDMYETGHPWDASPEWVHRHIEQLEPILRQNSDVILCLQAGFIGVWGEWAYTDHFVQAPATPQDHALRKEVMVKLLNAMPKNRQIALRTPMFKKNMFLGSYADSVTIATAYNESDISRICGHNDCFGADASDMGTFVAKGSRDFWKKETKYLLMGGETCQVSEYCKCEKSLQDMEDYHWTYLNAGYHPNVITRWIQNGCFKEISRRLGYRLSLTEVSHTKDIAKGKDLRVVIGIKNTGFAAPMNPREVELVLVDGNGKKQIFRLDDIDPRYWFAGTTVKIDRVIEIPADAEGKCTLYLNLPDPEFTLNNKPRFSIRLANDDIWDEEYGYNKIMDFII